MQVLRRIENNESMAFTNSFRNTLNLPRLGISDFYNMKGKEENYVLGLVLSDVKNYKTTLNLELFKDIRKDGSPYDRETVDEILEIRHIGGNQSLGIGSGGKVVDIFSKRWNSETDEYFINIYGRTDWIRVPREFVKTTVNQLGQNACMFAQYVRNL
jgi:hypothetical protein